MRYIILDLEWNTAYVKKIGDFLNEIIEVGAVMTDSEFNVIDTFTQLIKPKYSKKLSSRVKKLTNIQNEDLQNGKPFMQVMDSFRKWMGNGDTVVCSWGDTDIRTLVSNYKLFNGANHVPFMKKYCNLQAYTQSAFNPPITNQPGLSFVAEELGIDTESLELHRALTDCSLTVMCVKKLHNPELLKGFIKICDAEFYRKLFFKPKIITDINNPLVNKNEFCGSCPECGKTLTLQGEWAFKSGFFRAMHTCESCDKQYNVNVRFKICFDKLEIRKRIDPILPKEDEAEEKEAITAE
ncbi:MAG: exonuclease domain-containing protein [Clostridia bacterium]|nr:exonuclease domain-containing protein [Clostridia bacterium]